jgi:hypothetical protein
MVYPKRKHVNRFKRGRTTVVVHASEGASEGAEKKSDLVAELVARAMATLDSVEGPVDPEVVARELDQVAFDQEVTAELVARFGRDRIEALQSRRTGGVQ